MRFNNEVLIEDNRGNRKLIPIVDRFPSDEDLRIHIEKKYPGYKVVGIQEGLFNEPRT